MGATTFQMHSRGRSAREAFQAACDEARYERGHGGYSGTIVEKHVFVMIDVPAGHRPQDSARELLDADDPVIAAKWGPAGCIALGEGGYLFVGWALSPGAHYAG